jgi:hypothetical protein
MIAQWLWFGLTVLKSPPYSPKANAICERMIGTIRRECLDWLIPLMESHLRSILKSWVRHYNHGRPHMAGPELQSDRPRSCRSNRDANQRLAGVHRKAGQVVEHRTGMLGQDRLLPLSDEIANDADPVAACHDGAR